MKFKNEDPHTAALLFNKTHEYLFKFNLKYRYHHVDIYPKDSQFLGFSGKTKV